MLVYQRSCGSQLYQNNATCRSRILGVLSVFSDKNLGTFSSSDQQLGPDHPVKLLSDWSLAQVTMSPSETQPGSSEVTQSASTLSHCSAPSHSGILLFQPST